MRAVLFIAFSGAVWAQQVGAQESDDARSLLEQVAQAARAMQTVRVEGSTSVERLGSGPAARTSFTLEMRKPRYARLEQKGAVETLTVCDGAAAWRYGTESKQYTESRADTLASCIPAAMDWEHVADRMQSATFMGNAEAELDGQVQACQLVRAAYRGARDTRTFCIDPVRKLFLRARG